MRRILLIVVTLCVFLPKPAAAQSETAAHLVIGAYVVAGFADTAQTAYCLGAKTCIEANPVLRPLMGIGDQKGVARALTVKGLWHVGGSYLLLRMHKEHPKLAFWTGVAMASAQTAVVVHNARVSDR
jgi:hypothetical protein